MHGLQDAGLCVCYFVLFSGHAGCSGSDHDFVTNSYGESWNSSCEQITSHTPEPLSPSSKNKTGKSLIKMLGPLCDMILRLKIFF